MIRNKLLGNIYFGTELAKLNAGVSTTIEALNNNDSIFSRLSEKDWKFAVEIVSRFFSKSIRGKFGGPITAGDAFFITAFMSASRPPSMIEVGVCSGVSSAFILYAADKLGLTRPGSKFLYSFDLLKLHGDDQLEVGRVVRMNYPSLLEYWDLNVEVTAPMLALNLNDLREKVVSGTPTLAFIDANHMHPWPVVDVLAMAKILPPNSWILLQDTQLMERWLGNCVEFGAPSPRPCRGVGLAVTFWPGNKVVGWDMCYNMGAVKVDATPSEITKYVSSCLAYPAETGANQGDECRKLLEKLSD